MLRENMYKLFERAKPNDADLLSEIQIIDPASFAAAMCTDVGMPTPDMYVVSWLQVSPVFPSQIIQ